MPLNQTKQTWTIDKKATHKAVLVNTEKRILSYNKDLFWVRIAGVNGSKLYIYSMKEAKPFGQCPFCNITRNDSKYPCTMCEKPYKLRGQKEAKP